VKRCGLKLFWILLLLPLPLLAGNTDAEIQYLLDTTGESGCAFIRNGEAHSATDAEAHLRMKYGRGKKWVDSAEQFIERIASKSSWSGKPYYMDCPDAGQRTVGDWLSGQLNSYRKQEVQEQ
jgi:hypothetical protein